MLNLVNEDFEIVQKNSGVFVVRDKRTGEEHPKISLSIKEASKLKNKLEKGGISKRVKLGEEAGTVSTNAVGAGNAIAGLVGEPVVRKYKLRPKIQKRKQPEV